MAKIIDLDIIECEALDLKLYEQYRYIFKYGNMRRVEEDNIVIIANDNTIEGL